MKLLLVLLVAVFGAVLAQDPIEPVMVEFGQLNDGDRLLDIYYTETAETDDGTLHTIDINWEAQDITYIRVYITPDYTNIGYTGLPSSEGTITVENSNTNKLEVYAYLYGEYTDE